MAKQNKGQKPRKFAQQERAKQTVEAILEAAARILSINGILPFSTNQIARVAGVGIGSLYEYFPNKFSIVRKLAEARIQRELDVIKEVMDRISDLPLEEGCPQLVDALVSLYKPSPRLDKILLENLYSTGAADLKEAQDQVVSWVTDLIQKRSEDLHSEDPRYTAFIAVHSIQAIIQSAATKKPELLSDMKFVKEISRMFVNYLGRSGHEKLRI